MKKTFHLANSTQNHVRLTQRRYTSSLVLLVTILLLLVGCDQVSVATLLSEPTATIQPSPTITETAVPTAPPTSAGEQPDEVVGQRPHHDSDDDDEADVAPT